MRPYVVVLVVCFLLFVFLMDGCWQGLADYAIHVV